MYNTAASHVKASNFSIESGGTAGTARDAVGRFIKMMGTILPPHGVHSTPVLVDRVKAITRTWPFEDRIHRHITTGILMAEITYSHLSDIDARAAVAVYTALMVLLDDQEVYHKVGAEHFAQMLCGGSALDDQGPLGQAAKVLADMGQHFSPFGTTTIVSSTLRAMCGEMLCNPSNPFSIEPQSKKFIDYHRSLTGYSEAFAMFIWCKADFPVETAYIHVLPEICFFIDHANDILSFYKEDLDEDATSYIHSRARIAGRSPRDILFELLDEVVAAAEHVREHLGEGRARDAWDKFEADYMWFHFDNPRYRLREIVDAEYYTVN